MNQRFKVILENFIQNLYSFFFNCNIMKADLNHLLSCLKRNKKRKRANSLLQINLKKLDLKNKNDNKVLLKKTFNSECSKLNANLNKINSNSNYSNHQQPSNQQQQQQSNANNSSVLNSKTKSKMKKSNEENFM